MLTRRELFAATLALPVYQADPAEDRWNLVPEHPRLFFRREKWGAHGLTLAEVRRRGAGFADSLRVNHRPDPEAAPDWAMAYVITGDGAAAQTAIRHMKRNYDVSSHWVTTQGEQIEAIATAYDWLRGTGYDFATPDAEEIQQNLITGARTAIRNLSRSPSIYHTRMYSWANAVLFTGLALWGDRKEAAEFVDFGIRYWKQRLIPARRHLGGAWFNAMSYGQKYMCRCVFSMLTAWHSASGENLWKRSHEQEGDWARNMLYYLMYQLRPDCQFGGYGDTFNSMANCCQGTLRLVEQATAETRDPFGQGFLNEIRRHCHDRSTRWESRWYRVFVDPSLPARPRSELPLSRLFGRDSIGMTIMRSGWGPDDTWILFKCGDYGDDHGHFDQGHFEIFHRGVLAPDFNYWSKATIFHNTILISDPLDPHDEGNQREFSHQFHGTLDSYLADPVVQTGDILDYREEGATTYVLGDVTPAYEPEKVEQFTRQMVFVERRYLVIFDTVTVAHPRLRRRFLLHYPTEPRISGARFAWVNGGGELITETILPRKARITAIPTSAEGRPPNALKFKRYWPAGRVEVEPAASGSETTFFLHVLSPVDAGGKAASYEFKERPDSYRLTLAGKELTFNKNGKSCSIRTA